MEEMLEITSPVTNKSNGMFAANVQSHLSRGQSSTDLVVRELCSGRNHDAK